MFDVRKFGSYISRLRKQRNITQSELSDALNVTRQSVSKWENGDSFPDISILIMVADYFGVTVDTLINAGQPTQTEAEILKKTAMNEGITEKLLEGKRAGDVINIAPLLKPDVLADIADIFAKQGMDIGHITELAEFLNDNSIAKLLKSANYNSISSELLEKFLPFLDNSAKEIIFSKILSGELDESFIKSMLPFSDYGFISLVEAAVIDGSLDKSALQTIGEFRGYR